MEIIRMNSLLLRFILMAVVLLPLAATCARAETFVGQTVTLDSEGKLIPWFAPANRAYHEFLVRRWNFVKNAPASPPSASSVPVQRSNFPQYYFYNGYVTRNTNSIDPDSWMNDVGEKIPNWFENARLYYAYTGDLSVMTIVKGMVDHSLDYGTTPANFAVPKFPYTTTNVGDTVYQGFTTAGRFVLHEVHFDHGGDMGLTYFRMWQFYGEQKYFDAAVAVADALVANVRTGDRENSVWPYRINAQTGQITSQYAANWIGCHALLDELVKGSHGTPARIAAYTDARDKARAWTLAHPVVTGYWTDGHSDTQINSSTYRSNLSKSNYALYILDHPDFDPDRATNFPKYVEWTEEYFVNRIQGGEPGERATFYGANVVGEQDTFNFKMDYQTARYAAELARWYALTGDESYREKAYRSLNFVTYCSDLNGRATESPFSLGVATWWSDCYGEAPRMFFHAFAGMPEWAEPGANHILYSYEILTDVAYNTFDIAYTAAAPSGTEYFRLTFVPTSLTVGGVQIPRVATLPATGSGWTLRALSGGDYAVTLRRAAPGRVILATTEGNYAPSVSLTSPAPGLNVTAPASVLLEATASDSDGTIAKVEFYNNFTKLGEALAAPFTLQLTGLPIGSYSFTAVATDDDGAITYSSAVAFTSVDGNAPPTVSITSPSAGASLVAPANILLTANASDSDGTIAKVEFYQNTTKLGEDLTAPFALPLTGLNGSYSFRAIATDDNGRQTTSAAVAFIAGPAGESRVGSSSDGTTTDFITDGTGTYINACRFQAGSSFSAQGIRARVNAISGTYTVALYADNNGSASTLIQTAASRTGVGSGWQEFVFPAPVSINTSAYYWLAIWSDDPAAGVWALPAGQVRFASYPFAGGWPSAISLSGAGSFTYSIYAFGTVSPNTAPGVSAGPDQSITLPAAAALAGTANDPDGPSTLATEWTLVSGPGSVTFGNAASPNTTATFSTAGTYVLRLAASDGPVTTADELTVTAAPAVSFAAWIAVFPLTGDDVDTTADPDHDGANNLLEYALGGNPAAAESDIFPTFSHNNSNQITFTFLRAAISLIYIVQGSTDLTDWQDLATHFPADTTNVGSEVALTRSATPYRFLRLKVVEP